MLSIGAALLGSPYVLGLDVDSEALEVAAENCEQFEEPLPVRRCSSCHMHVWACLHVQIMCVHARAHMCTCNRAFSALEFTNMHALCLQVDFVQCDVTALAAGGAWHGLRADTVIMNPPFGTKTKVGHADMTGRPTRASLGLGAWGCIWQVFSGIPRTSIGRAGACSLQYGGASTLQK